MLRLAPWVLFLVPLLAGCKCRKEPGSPATVPPTAAAGSSGQAGSASAVPGAPGTGQSAAVATRPSNCHKYCSDRSNRQQARGFTFCDSEKGVGLEKINACKAQILATTDAARNECREACDRRRERRDAKLRDRAAELVRRAEASMKQGDAGTKEPAKETTAPKEKQKPNERKTKAAAKEEAKPDPAPK